MTTYITGHTYPYRERLKQLGARWDGDEKRWSIWKLSASELAELRASPGLQVISDAPKPQRSSITPAAALLHPPSNPVQIGDDMTYYNYFCVKNPIAYFGFSSLPRFVEHVASLERPENHKNYLCDVGWTVDREYSGTDNLEQAINIARNGWIDGLGMMEQLLTVPPVRKQKKRSVAGGTINIGRMLSGAPDHMTKRAKAPARKIITLFVETVMWEGIKADLAVVRTVVIAAMVDRLEAEGYQCNIIATYMGLDRERHRGVQFAVSIKQAGERLNLADVSFAFGHPSFGRRLCYATKGVVGQTAMRTNHRGVISEAFNEDAPPGRNEFYIPQLRSNMADTFEKMIEVVQPDGLPIDMIGALK